ncbi:MAG: molybdopterin-dependent oxidoreductase [Mycobacterium sp.]
MWDNRPDTIVHEESSFNAEPAPSALCGRDVTPVDTFYSRNHGPIPEIGKDVWHLTIDGLVTTPLVLSFAELTGRFRTLAVIATLQCAGIRRTRFNRVRDIPVEDPWGPGATSTAEWSGARLLDVLDAVGVTSDPSLHVAFGALDVSDLATPVQPYGGSIPLSKAMSEEALLAWGMNLEPLPRVHGGPVRVVVPGYISARSVKWITSITVQPAPSSALTCPVTAASPGLTPTWNPRTAGVAGGCGPSRSARRPDRAARQGPGLGQHRLHPTRIRCFTVESEGIRQQFLGVRHLRRQLSPNEAPTP